MPFALTVKKIEGARPGEVYYPLELKEVPKPTPGPRQVLVRIKAAALNHRDLFIRQHLYPGIAFGRAMLADGYGIVEALGPGCTRGDELAVGRAVVLAPMRGWASSAEGPEDLSRYTVIGATRLSEAGTAQEFAVVGEDEAEPAPAHLTAAEGAALPLVGLTGWRALVGKSGNALPGRNLLVTGVGGGVALQVLQFAVARRCAVFVTSGDAAKVERAVALGARAGVCYRDPAWPQALAALLPAGRPYLDAVVDGAGGDIVRSVVRLLKPGGVISSYGMTTGPSMDWPMQAVMKNIELRGCTMGSAREFRDMVAFVDENKIRPVVSKVVRGLDNADGIEELFDDMKEGRQFGKLVIEIGSQDTSKL